MEYQKITKLLDTTSDNLPRFITEKWIAVHDQPGKVEDRNKPSKQIRFKTSMLRSDLCDYSDAYIVVKGDISLAKTADRDFIDVRNRVLASKSNAVFIDSISKINGVLMENGEDIDVAMPV